MRKLVLILLAVGLLPLPACNAENAEETKTVEWYMAPGNKQALQEKIAECRNNPGKLEKTPNCINAQEAADRVVLGAKMYQGKQKEMSTF